MNTRPCGRIFAFALITIAALSLSCAYLEGPPAYESRPRHVPPYSRLLIISAMPSYDLQTFFETEIAARLSELGCQGICAFDVFVPGKEYNADEFLDVIDEVGADGLLLLRPTNVSAPPIILPREFDWPTGHPFDKVYVAWVDPPDGVKRQFVYAPPTWDSMPDPDHPVGPVTAVDVRFYNCRTGVGLWQATVEGDKNARRGEMGVMRSIGLRIVRMLRRRMLIDAWMVG